MEGNHGLKSVCNVPKRRVPKHPMLHPSHQVEHYYGIVLFIIMHHKLKFIKIFKVY